MANQPAWLNEYYGPEADILNPSVVQEGENWAIVRLTKTSRSPGSSNIGYVLVKKTGRHIATPHVSLHEGVATEVDLQRMQGVLQKYESEP